MPPRSESVLIKYNSLIAFALMGGGSVVFANFMQKRPLRTSLHRTIILGAIGLFLGMKYRDYFQNRYAERDAVMRHYMELHPEDFKDERKKYRDLFEDWYPIR